MLPRLQNLLTRHLPVIHRIGVVRRIGVRVVGVVVIGVLLIGAVGASGAVGIALVVWKCLPLLPVHRTQLTLVIGSIQAGLLGPEKCPHCIVLGATLAIPVLIPAVLAPMTRLRVVVANML